VNGLSTRLFLLNDQDALYILPLARFELMHRNPQRHRIPRFAAARVRMVEMSFPQVFGHLL